MSSKQARQERERALQQLDAADSDRSDGRGELRFDEELIERYTRTLLGCRTDNGRATHVIEFEPHPSPGSKRTRLDAILNRVRGELWIDAETYEIRRVRFALTEGASVRLAPKLVGFLGGLKALSGTFERAPVSQGDWLPRSLELETKGRAWLRGFHIRETTVWTDFTPWSPRTSTARRPEASTGGSK